MSRPYAQMSRPYAQYAPYIALRLIAGAGKGSDIYGPLVRKYAHPADGLLLAGELHIGGRRLLLTRGPETERPCDGCDIGKFHGGSCATDWVLLDRTLVKKEWSHSSGILIMLSCQGYMLKHAPAHGCRAYRWTLSEETYDA